MRSPSAAEAAAVPKVGRRGAAAWALPVAFTLGLAALLGLHFALLHTYWDYSEGVYALTAQLELHGHGVYTQVVGAQPPGIFLVGAALLAIHQSLEWLRFGVALLQLFAGLLAALIVWRVSRHRLAAAVTPALVLLSPWAVHEHGALTAELVGLPLLFGAVVTAPDSRKASITGILCGLAPLFKVPFVVPAVAIALASATPKRTAAWASASLLVGATLALAIGGSGVWRDVILAQGQVGLRGVGALAGYWSQAAWNLLGLGIGAAVSFRYRRQALDSQLYQVALAFACAALLTLISTAKVGTSLDTVVLSEAALAPISMCGLVFAVSQVRRRIPGSRLLAGAAFAGIVVLLTQSTSLLIAPHRPIPFLRPGSQAAWGEVMSAAQTRAAVARARECPAGTAYGGPPLIAMLAGRRVPADQPDQFIVPRAAALSTVAAKVASVRPICG
jgi:hypothetical protein